MLVLTRKTEQKIIIGEQSITVTVLRIDSGSVRIGIDAPKEIPINREEILRKKEKKDA